MATNKHATIRYHALDRCFSNLGRKFYINDLVEACNEALYEFDGVTDGVKKRQVYSDISFMESEQGWSIPLDRIKEGRRVYFRYSDRNFSIKDQGINQTEAEQLRDTLTILSRFKGLPHFDWIEEMQIRLEDTFKLKNHIISAVSFEQNPYLKGLKYFRDLFNAIKYKQSLSIEYQGFKQKAVSNIILHPWHLKQYNNRWFLFGYNESYNSLSNLAIDRIVSLTNAEATYIENTEINFEDYFEDIVGVSIKPEEDTEEVVLSIHTDIWPYIESKPIHGSQKVIDKKEKKIIIKLDLQINHELIALLFSYLDGVEVLKPERLRLEFKEVSKSIQNKYL